MSPLRAAGAWKDHSRPPTPPGRRTGMKGVTVIRGVSDFVLRAQFLALHVEVNLRHSDTVSQAIIG